MAEVFWVGAAVRGRIRAMGVDPITEAETPQTSLPSVTLRFRNPDGTVLATRTLADGVVNGGNGYYYATAEPTQEGRHYFEAETGGALPGRSKVGFTVEAF